MKNLAQKGYLLLTSMLIVIFITSCGDDDTAFVSEAMDSDGDGIEDSVDSEPQNPCMPEQQMAYTGFDVFNDIWANADCDDDGVTNGVEFEDQKRNPYLDENMVDTDGDGIADYQDEAPEDPCLPAQEEGYLGFNSENDIWAAADCDGDTISNIVEFTNGTDPYFACNLSFDLSNFARELRTVDSSNGEGITIGALGKNCGEYIFSGGGIFNQGCFNDDVELLFIFEPNETGLSEGSITVPSTTYSCVSEDGTETTQFTVEGTGTYQGELTRIEFNYTLTTEDGTEDGTLNIRGLDDPGDGDGGDDDCNLDFDFSNFDGELLANDSNNGENLVTGSLLDSCNEISISGDFLNLGCTNDEIQILLFLEPFEDGGSEGNVIVENATFSCTSEDGSTTEYTFNSFGSFNGDDGTIELTDYTLEGGGETITGTVNIGVGANGGGDRCSFAGEYGTIITIDGVESFGVGILTQNPENCNEYKLSGDFLNQGCTNDFELDVFFGEEVDGSEILIEDATYTCESNGSSLGYTFTGFGNYSSAEGFIQFTEFTLTDAAGAETTGTIFFEAQ